MKQAIKLWALIAIGAIACIHMPDAQAAARGSIRGLIKDGLGNPLAGAAVLVLTAGEEAKSEKLIKRASTDSEGKFIASGILPGQYRLKAEADGFKPVVFDASVQPNKVTVFDSIKMRREGTLAEETNLNLGTKYATRKARGSIFHFEEPGTTPAEADEESVVALTDRASDMHGYVHTFAQTTVATKGDASSFVGANFAVAEQLGRSANLVVSGQGGLGDGAMQSLKVVTTAHAGDRHRFAVALGYGRFTFSRRGSIPNLGQFSLSATDTWQVSGPVLIVYGLEVARFTEGATGTSVLPRFGIAVDATPRTRLFAGLAPGSSVDAQEKVNLESGEIVFAEPKTVALRENGENAEPVMDRSYRLQFGGEQILSDKSSVEMMAFFDTVSGHGVGLLAVPLDRPESREIMRNEAQSGRSRGVRVVYHRRLTDVVDGSIGYAFGEGQRLDPRGITDPGDLFENSLFHIFSAKIDANFVRTGTKVSTVLRIAPEQAVFAIDPFEGQIATNDPNLSVSLIQDLPRFGFMPGQLQAIVDLRNLLDQQASVADDQQELLTSRFHRLVRVGVSLRF